jgi:hypothetical protein
MVEVAVKAKAWRTQANSRLCERHANVDYGALKLYSSQSHVMSNCFPQFCLNNKEYHGAEIVESMVKREC